MVDLAANLLAVDVGNSRIKFGWMGAASAGKLPECREVLAVPHGEPIPWELLRGWRDQAGADPHAIIAGVQPQGVLQVLQAWSQGGWPEPHVVRSFADLPLAIDMQAPQSVGIDRLLNAVAANRLRSPGQPALVVDSGTAITVGLLDARGAFRGGAILPGVELQGKALHQYTALLPCITPGELQPVPAACGQNTQEAIRSGLYWGHVGAVREVLTRLQEELISLSTGPGSPGEPLRLLTGGAADLLFPQLGFQKIPHLPLRGLAVVASQSSSTSSGS